MYKGIAASAGIASAKIYKMISPEIVIDDSVGVMADELANFQSALLKTENQLEKIKQKTLDKLDAEHAAIFDAHKLVLKDPEYVNAIKNEVTTKGVNVAYATKTIADQFVAIFENMDNEYMRERAADIKDVTKRLLANIKGIRLADPSLIDEEVIIIAEDLTPSDTAQLDKKYVKGFITEIGGRTSHSAIMARSLEIPAVVGVGQLLEKVTEEDTVLLDGLEGNIIVNPSEEEIAKYEKIRVDYEAKKVEWAKLKDARTVSKDGTHFEIAANIGSPEDLEGVLNNGAEGIGLFRTEFLYMGKNNFPTEEEQFLVYKEVLERMEGKPVVVRTLDIGGDKELPYLDLPKELNPFLGYRAIRLCLDRKDIFKVQLRALLRASVYGNLKVMFPMIATVNEFVSAKNVLLEVEQELKTAGYQVSDSYEVGMMVEIPAAAILADQFAKVSDFFSIGTNDLIQYSFAADRMNESVGYLYQPYNPSLLRLIKMVIDAAHKEGRWAGMCGEVAGDQTAIPLLVGLGLDEFSMSATSILESRSLMSKLDSKEMATLALEALNQSTNEEVKALVEEKVGV
jgi:phosphotransferase system enzyme I (PtsI)